MKTIKFSGQYPNTPGYLGTVHSSCGRCSRGAAIIHSSTIPSEKPVIENITAVIMYTVDGVEKNLTCDTRYSAIEEILRPIIERHERGSSTDDTYKEWLETLTPHDSPKPSGNSFLGVVQGLGEKYECESIPVYQTPNAQGPGFKKAYWFERWPTESEALSMKKNFSKFAFGVPSNPHPHGN